MVMHTKEPLHFCADHFVALILLEKSSLLRRGTFQRCLIELFNAFPLFWRHAHRQASIRYTARLSLQPNRALRLSQRCRETWRFPRRLGLQKNATRRYGFGADRALTDGRELRPASTGLQSALGKKQVLHPRAEPPEFRRVSPVSYG